jgi:hypothetical protein
MVQRRFKHMNASRSAAGSSSPPWSRQILVLLLVFLLLFGIGPQSLWAYQDAQAPPPAPGQPGQAAPYLQHTPEQLQQIVAPIALYPDSLVAQILAASTFPEQVVEADRWLQAHPELKDQELAQAADQQTWDPSVKALVAFPSVLGNMDKNLSWTSSLGDAYYNQEQAVMDAIQAMRQKAEQAGNLKTTPQQNVSTEGSDVVIQPADPQIVYVPAYDPWLVYGYPIVAWPGWYPYPGIWFEGPYLSFGLGFGIGWFGGFGWGWGHWGFDWHNHWVRYGGGRYYSRSNTFYNRGNYYRGGGERGVAANVQRGNERGNERGGERGSGRGDVNRGGDRGRAPGGDTRGARGYGDSRGQSGTRSGAFSGYARGGDTRGYSSRGQSSFGGGGFRGGGGGRGGGGRGRP